MIEMMIEMTIEMMIEISITLITHSYIPNPNPNHIEITQQQSNVLFYSLLLKES